MHVARMESVRDLAGRLVQDGRLLAHRPFALERPLIERQAGGGGTSVAMIQCGRVTRYKGLTALVSDVGFGRSQVGPISGGFEAATVERHEPVARSGNAGLRQQLLNRPLRPFVLALAKLM